jgi:hypothetical protein
VPVVVSSTVNNGSEKRMTELSPDLITDAVSAYHYLGGITAFLAAPEMMPLFLTDPAGFIRQGGSPGLSSCRTIRSG